MSGPKLTPWFTAESGVKPVRKGVYQTQLLYSYSNSVISNGYSRWTGRRWCDTNTSAEDAANDEVPGGQKKNWRGLAQEPKQ